MLISYNKVVITIRDSGMIKMTSFGDPQHQESSRLGVTRFVYFQTTHRDGEGSGAASSTKAS